jgi:hypothetical protein
VELAQIALLFALVLIGCLAVASGPALQLRLATRSQAGPVLAAVAGALPLLALGGYVSLAAHMYWRLGAWPATIGTDGFASDLTLHATVAQFLFWSLVAGLILGVPGTLLACAATPRLRPGARYVGLYVLLAVAVLGLFLLMPGDFRHWWWD